MQGWVKKFTATLQEWAYLNFLATSAINEVADAILMSRRGSGSFGSFPEFLSDEQRYRLREYDACANLQQEIRDQIGEEDDWRDDLVVQKDKYDCIEMNETFRSWMALMHLACIAADPKRRSQQKSDKAPHKRREYLAVVEAAEGCANLMARIDHELIANLVTYRECPQEYTALQPGRFWGAAKVYSGPEGLLEMEAEDARIKSEERKALKKQKALTDADRLRRQKKKK